MRGLYAIVDMTKVTSEKVDPLAFVEAVLRARPVALQLRAKTLGARDFLGLLRAVLPYCRRAGVPLFANDRADLAALAGCDGVHIGQGDMPIHHVRRLAPSLRVGLSTHSLEQLAEALALRPDYVAYGPVFPTTTKTDAEPVVGLDGLARAADLARRAAIPLVAIGGITLNTAPQVGAFGISAAVIGDIVSQASLGMAQVAARATALHETIREAQTVSGCFGAVTLSVTGS
jgi:thiamine-phosphate pyrophosphorylase